MWELRLTAQTKAIEGTGTDVLYSHLSKECAEISYFDFDLKTTIMIL